MNIGRLLCTCLCAVIPATTAAAQDDIHDRSDAAFYRERGGDPLLPAPARHPPARAVRSRMVVTRGPFTSVQVNIDESGNDMLGDAANEPSIAIDPNDTDRVVIGWRQFDNIASNFRQAGWAYSEDGGHAWTFPGVIEPGVFRSDPVLDTDLDGNFYYFSLTTDFDNWECALFKSTDGGVSWGEGVPAFGGDKGWMAIDRTAGIGRGNIYAKWQTFFNCCGSNTFTRSTNGGASFIPPVAVPLGPSFGTLAVGPEGEVYVAGIEAVDFQDFNTIVIARSTNAKNLFQTPEFELATEVDLGGSLGFSEGPNPDGLLGQVGVGTDHSDGPTRGNVYMLASLDPPGGDPLDVMFSRSEDGGQTWSAPVRVNDDPTFNGAWQWFGTLAVAPDGRIDAVWNDTRSSGDVDLSELYYSYSLDTGQTWSTNVPVSPVFDSSIGWPSQNKLGDYYDLISFESVARLAYAATFTGGQDVYYLEVGDCNANGVHDGIDLASGSAHDNNGNGLLDQCECTTDLDGNGDTGASDLAILLGAWGPNPGLQADFNGDGVVDANDLAQLLGNWGPC